MTFDWRTFFVGHSIGKLIYGVWLPSQSKRKKVRKKNRDLFFFFFLSSNLRSNIIFNIFFICKISKNKASRGYGIPVELFQILKNDAVKVLY